MAASDVCHPLMKLRRSFFSEDLSNCRASMRAGLIRFRFAVSVSFADDVTPQLYLCYMHFISDIIISLCVLPARLPTLYQTLSDLTAISIFSSYVPLCDTSLIFLFMYRYSHAYISLHLDSLMTPFHCYVHAPLSFASIDSISFAMSSLPYCASMYAFPATDVYFYDTYDVFFP